MLTSYVNVATFDYEKQMNNEGLFTLEYYVCKSWETNLLFWKKVKNMKRKEEDLKTFICLVFIVLIIEISIL